MATGSTIGLMAKLGVETDERQVKRETETLKDKITQAAEAEMTTDVDSLKHDITRSIEEAAAESKWVPDTLSDRFTDAIGTGAAKAEIFDEEHVEQVRSQMEALGHEVGPGTQFGRPTREGGDMISDIFGGMKGAGGKFLKVGLAGAVGFGILAGVTKLSDTAPRMNKVLEQIWRSISLFARPFFDLMARLIEPYAQEMLELAAQFNADYNQDGLAVAVVRMGENILEDEDAGLGGRIGRQTGIFPGAVGGAKKGVAGGALLGPKGAIAGGAIGAVGGALGGMHIGGKVGDALGNAFSSLADWLKDAWPGWDTFLTFPGWVDVIIDAFPGWLKNSPGIIDPFPGWSEWLNPLNWDIPGASEVGRWIQDEIPELGWEIPSSSDKRRWVREEIPTLDWNIPSWRDKRRWVREEIPTLDWNIPSWRDKRRWIRARINTLDWNIPTWRSMRNWVQDEIPTLDWNIPSASDIEDIFRDQIPEFSWPDVDFDMSGGGRSLDPRTHFAEGGLVTRPTNALIGEAGPEIVAPFSEFMNAVNAPDRRFGGINGGGGGGGTAGDVDDIVSALEAVEKKLDNLDADVVLEIDGKEIARASRDANRRYQSSTVVTK